MRKTILFITVVLIYSAAFAQNTGYMSKETCPFEISNHQSITSVGERYNLPKISPDGTKVMFTKSGKKGIYLVNLSNKGAIKTILEESIYGDNLKWSKDGNYIIYEKRDNSKSKISSENVFSYDIVDSKHGAFNRTNKKEGQVQVSLNVRQRKVEAFDGTNRWFVTKEPGSYYNFVVSPDNSKVIIKSDHIYIYSIDGNEIIDTGIERGIATDWSPDCKYFLYYIEKDDGHSYTESDLYISSVDGKNKWKLTTTNDIMEARPTWSVNGNKITFVDYSSGKIFIADLKMK